MEVQGGRSPTNCERTFPDHETTLYVLCVRNVMLYGSEVLAVKDDGVKRLEPAEKSTVRWMCCCSMRDGPTVVELRSRLGI